VERYGRVKKRSMQEIQARDVVAACDALMEEVGTPRAPQGVDD
jgi:hypothetical protein